MTRSSLLTLGLLLCLSIFSATSEPEINSANKTKGTIGKDALLAEILKCPIGSTDAQLSACFTKFVGSLGPKVAAGIPELGLKPFDPFRLDTLTYSINLWPIVPKVIFNNILIEHLTKYDVQSIIFDTAAKSIKCVFNLSYMTAHANYTTDGNFPLMRLIGDGPARIEVSGGKAIWEWKFKIDQDSKTGKNVLQLDDFKLDLDYDDAKMQVDGLLNKIPTWDRFGPLLNRFHNDYHKELYQIIKPEFINGMVIPVVTRIVNQFLVQMPELIEYFEN